MAVATLMRRVSMVVTPLLLIALLVMNITGFALATHEPADKTVAAGTDIDEVQGQALLLRDVMRVSTTSDLILQTTAECSILTALRTGEAEGANDSTDNALAFGQIEMFITVDGNRVPVAVDDPVGPDPNPDDPNETQQGDEQGEVVFCNRAYERSVADSESNEPTDDGLDTEQDYIRTRTANAFNWFALNAGNDATYDEASYGGVTGNNMVVVELWGEYDTKASENGSPVTPVTCANGNQPSGTCAQAFVGSRTLIIEPVHASVHEQVEENTGVGS